MVRNGHWTYRIISDTKNKNLEMVFVRMNTQDELPFLSSAALPPLAGIVSGYLCLGLHAAGEIISMGSFYRKNFFSGMNRMRWYALYTRLVITSRPIISITHVILYVYTGDRTRVVFLKQYCGWLPVPIALIRKWIKKKSRRDIEKAFIFICHHKRTALAHSPRVIVFPNVMWRDVLNQS